MFFFKFQTILIFFMERLFYICVIDLLHRVDCWIKIGKLSLMLPTDAYLGLLSSNHACRSKGKGSPGPQLPDIFLC